MIEGIASGLFAGWILTLFGFDDICLSVIQPFVHFTTLTVKHYYFVFAVTGLIVECTGKIVECIKKKK